MLKAKVGEKSKARGRKHLSVGEEVMGKWPGSPLWYEAIVVSIDYDKNTCVLQFNDGQENEIPISHVSVSSSPFYAK